MPRWCATTAPGLEPIVREELATHGAKPTQLPFRGDGLVGFEIPTRDHGLSLFHKLRTVHRIGEVLATTQVDPEDPWNELEHLAQTLNLDDWVDERTRWAVRIARYGEHPYGSPDVEQRLGHYLDQRFQQELTKRPPVDLENPDTLLRGHLDDDGTLVLWADLVGTRSLHRRGVRKVDHPAAMKGTLAAALLHALDWDPTTGIADPMGGGGTLLIEAAWLALDASPVHLRAHDLLAHRVPWKRGTTPDPGPAVPKPVQEAEPELVLGDHAPNRLKAARTNLEAAGVLDRVRIYEGDAGELPKHAENLGAVVANPPYGIRSGEGDLATTYRRLMEGAAKALGSDGSIGLLTPRGDLVEPFLDEFGFDSRRRLRLQHGRLSIELIVLDA